MISREMVKAAIDQLPASYMDSLYEIIQALHGLEGRQGAEMPKTAQSWQTFLDTVYGSTREAPIGRAPQGEYETREAM